MLAEALSQAYPGIIIGFDATAECVIVQHAGESQRIAAWRRPEPKPNEADVLAAFDARAYAVEQITERIKAERDRRRPLGVTVGAVKFHSDDTSRIQQLGLLMMGANMPAGLKWKVVGGAMVDMTPTLAQQVFAATAARDQALFAAAEAHIAAATASDDPAAYDYSAGWPE